MSIKLGDAVTHDKLFLVFLKDGKKQYALADGEDNIPVDIGNIAFAASLAEIEGWVRGTRGQVLS